MWFASIVLTLTACGSTAHTIATPELTAAVSSSVPDVPTTVGASLPAARAPASPLLVGDAEPQMPAGKPDSISATPIGPAAAPLDSGSTSAQYVVVPFVVWNTTAKAVDGLKLVASATDPGTGKTYEGTLAAFTPSHLDPGQWGLAAMQFLSAPSLPDSTVYDVSFTTDDFIMSRSADLEVRDLAAAPVSGIRTANIVNATSQQLGSPFTVAVYCFDADRVVSTQVVLWDAGANGYTFAPDASVPIKFSVDATCPHVLVGAVSIHE